MTRKRNPEVLICDLDARTVSYLELVSGKLGQAALDAWMLYSGWRDENDRSHRDESDFSQVRKYRNEHGGRRYALSEELKELGIDPNDPKYSPRWQIPLAERLCIAMDHACLLAELKEKKAQSE